MDMLATYQQRFAWVRRLFELQADLLTVHGRKLGSSFDVSYDLAALSPRFDQAHVRTQAFYGGFVMLVIALICFVILAFEGGLVLPALVIVGIMACVGLACVLFRARPLRVFIFKNRDGVYAFEIVGAGPDTDRVEQFALAVSEQIQRAHERA
jgi:hypothetical protein